MTNSPQRGKQLPVQLFHAVPCLFLGFLIAIKFPYDIYWGNVADLTFMSLAMLGPLLMAASLVFFAVYFPIVLLPGDLKLAWYGIVSVAALIVWFISSFLYKEVFVLDGRPLEFNLAGPMPWIELLLVIGLLVLVAFFARRMASILNQVNLLMLVLVAASSGVSYAMASKAHSQKALGLMSALQQSWQTFDDQLLLFSSKRNVIHLVLDELQTDIFQQAVERSSALREQLDGFVLYENTVGDHPNTIMAVPAMLTGEAYRNTVPIPEYLSVSLEKKLFTRRLDAEGYRSDFHTAPVFCNGTLYHCSPIPVGNGGAFAMALLDYSIFRSLPLLLKPWSYNSGSWRILPLAMAATGGGADNLAQTAQAVRLMEEFISEIRLGDAQPRYKLFHSMVTHSPADLDRNCQYTGRRANTREDKIEQAVCGMRILTDFLTRLRELNIYNSSLVIVSSDHGTDIFPPELVTPLASQAVEPRHFSRAQPVLLIKPIGATGRLKSSYVPAQLSDIPQTVFSALEIDGEGFAGLDIMSLSGSRSRNYWHYEDLIVQAPEGRFPKMWHYRIDGPVAEPSSWVQVELLEAEQ